MNTVNIMNTLTPKPPFDAAKKNVSVSFRIPKKSVGLNASGKVLLGVNRTVSTNKLK